MEPVLKSSCADFPLPSRFKSLSNDKGNDFLRRPRCDGGRKQPGCWVDRGQKAFPSPSAGESAASGFTPGPIWACLKMPHESHRNL